MKDRTLVSLMAEGANRNPAGLCTGRFRPDIVTKTLSYATLTPGMEILVDGKTLVIVSVGKPCHPECPLHQSGVFCQLKSNCAFGREKE